MCDVTSNVAPHLPPPRRRPFQDTCVVKCHNDGPRHPAHPDHEERRRASGNPELQLDVPFGVCEKVVNTMGIQFRAYNGQAQLSHNVGNQWNPALFDLNPIQAHKLMPNA